jgi:hypothetical protein
MRSLTWCPLCLAVALLACMTPAPGEKECTAACDAQRPCEDPSVPPEEVNRFVEGCIDSCIDEFARADEISDLCLDSYRNFQICWATLSCTEFSDWVLSPESGPCGDAYIEVTEVCEGLTGAQPRLLKKDEL